MKDKTVYTLPLEASQIHSHSVIVSNQHFESANHFEKIVSLIVTTLLYLESNFYGNLKVRLNSYNLPLSFKRKLDNYEEEVKTLFVGYFHSGSKAQESSDWI